MKKFFCLALCAALVAFIGCKSPEEDARDKAAAQQKAQQQKKSKEEEKGGMHIVPNTPGMPGVKVGPFKVF